MNTNIIAISSRCFHSKLVTDLAYKTNRYGEARDHELLLKAELAESIAEHRFDLTVEQEKRNRTIAQAITVALELGKPAYQEIGEAFLRDKDPSYAKSRLALLLTSLLLQGIECEEKNTILQETEKILEGAPNLSEEAKAAVLAIKIYDGANKFSKRSDFATVSSVALEKVLEATKENGCITEVPYIAAITERESEKKPALRSERHRKILDSAYVHYLAHYDEIPNDFITASDGLPQECATAYYVASLRETDLMKFESN